MNEAAVEPMSAPPVQPSRSWVKRLGLNFLTISILAHVLFGVGATYFIVQTISAKRKLTFEGGPRSPNPSTRAIEHKVQLARKQSTMSAPVSAKRITTTGLSKVALPAMPPMPKLDSSVTPAKMAGMGGMGISMMMGGAGGPGGGTGGAGMTLFGFKDGRGGGLAGTFYDLKQDRNRKPTGMTINKYPEVLTDFVQSGWNESHLDHFYRGPSTLYAPQIFMPDMNANKGPTAFGLQKEVEPKMWIVHYKGTVSPPESGVYSFVGSGDDVLMVRFDGKLVLSGNKPFSGHGGIVTNWTSRGAYDYRWPSPRDSTAFEKGDQLDLQAGRWYPMEVLIGEWPGGRGHADILVEQQGVDYKKDGKGNPILPIFRFGDFKPPPLEKGESLPPYQPGGPVWRSRAGQAGTLLDQIRGH